MTNGLCSPVVFDKIKVSCHWCGGAIREYVCRIRCKDASSDSPRYFQRWNYHEGCWCEAIEVEV